MKKEMFLLFFSFFCSPFCCRSQKNLENAEQKKVEEWHVPRKLSEFYKEMKKEKRIIITVHCGLWPYQSTNSNLHWDAYYGPLSMFERASKDFHIRKKILHHSWKKVYFATSEKDPIERAIFNQKTDEKDIYVVLLAYKDLWRAYKDCILSLKMDSGYTFVLNDTDTINTGKSLVVGYNGHNFYYDDPQLFFDFMDSLSRIEKKTKKKKGFFAIGCNTILFSRYITDAYILALTKDFMAPEGYNLLALIDGIIEEDEGKKLKERMDKTYFYFQHLNGKSPGPLFVNHEKGVYQIDR